MAFMNQERKSKLSPGIKAVLKKYDMKGSVAVYHHSTLVVNLKAGSLDIIGNYKQNSDNLKETEIKSLDVNHYWINEHYTGRVKDFLNELKAAMMIGNHDRSDAQTDYFDVGWYIDINVGKWNQPYTLTA